MEHPQGKTALFAGYLVVIKLHRIDGAAAEFVVARIRPKYRAQQHAGSSSFRMLWRRMNARYRSHASIVGRWLCEVGDVQYSNCDMTELLHSRPHLIRRAKASSHD